LLRQEMNACSIALATAFSGSAEYTWVLDNPVVIIQQKSRLEAWKILKKRSLSGSGLAPILAVYFHLFLRDSRRSSKTERQDITSSGRHLRGSFPLRRCPCLRSPDLQVTAIRSASSAPVTTHPAVMNMAWQIQGAWTDPAARRARSSLAYFIIGVQSLLRCRSNKAADKSVRSTSARVVCG